MSVDPLHVSGPGTVEHDRHTGARWMKSKNLMDVYRPAAATSRRGGGLVVIAAGVTAGAPRPADRRPGGAHGDRAASPLAGARRLVGAVELTAGRSAPGCAGTDRIGPATSWRSGAAAGRVLPGKVSRIIPARPLAELACLDAGPVAAGDISNGTAQTGWWRTGGEIAPYCQHSR